MKTDDVFKALAQPTRREILGLLRNDEMTAGALAERFDMTKPSMSHHFAILKGAGLVVTRREGQQIWYRLNITIIEEMVSWAMDLIGKGETRKKK